MISRIFNIFTESHLSFEGQEPGERVLKIVRKHAWVILLPLVFVAFLATGPLLAWYVFGNQIFLNNWLSESLFLTFLYYLCLWIFAFYFLTIYILNTVIITSERIVDNHQIGFFDRKVSELHIHRVQDVSVHTAGIIETLLHFGDLVVQTAAEEREFIFTNLPKPDELKDTIMRTVTERDRVTDGVN